MKKTKNSAWKRVAAGSLSMALVAGVMPANVGGLLTGGNAIVAHAEDYVLNAPTAYSETDQDANITSNDYGTIQLTTYKVDDQTYYRYTATPKSGYEFDYWTHLEYENAPLATSDDSETNFSYIPYEMKAYFKKSATVNTTPTASDLTLTAPSLTYTGSAQNLIVGAPQGTKFSLTAPIYSFNHDAAWAEQLMLKEYYNSMEEAADSADESTQTKLINAAHTLDFYRQAINHLYAGNPEDANSSIAAANVIISGMDTNFSTENNDINAILDYINTYIRGKNLDDLKERFNTAADTSSWSTDVPQKTDAGTYTVYYQGDGVNYNKEIKSVTVTIGKANLTITDYTAPTANNFTYTSSAQPLLEAGNIAASKGHFEYALGTNRYTAPESGWSTTIPEETNAGNYYVWYKIIGAEGYNNVAPQSITATIAKATLTETTAEEAGDYIAPTAAKSLKTAATDTEPAEYYDDLFYTGENQDLINAGSVDDGKGTMQYVLGTVHTINENTTINCEDICLGDIFYFPANVESAEVTISGENPNFYHNYARFFKDGGYVGEQAADGSGGWGSANNYNCIYSYTYGTSEGPKYYFTSGYYNPETGALTPSKTSTENRRNWSESVPAGNKAGKYNIAWRIAGNDNYNPVGGVIENEIKAKPALLTLTDLKDNNNVDPVVKDANGDQVDAGLDGYTLTGGNTYYIYTNKSISYAANDPIFESVTEKATLTGGYKYRYTISIPIDCADTYTYGHTHATSAINNEAGDQIIVQCSGESTAAAVVAQFKNAESIYYFGDYPKSEDIELSEAYGATPEIKDFFFSLASDTTDTHISKDQLEFGKEYKVNARVKITYADGNYTNVTISRVVTFKQRPMSENKYFLVTENPDFNTEQAESATNKKYIETPLEVVQDTDNENNPIVGQYSVIVPETAFAYNGTAKKPEIVVKNGGNEAVLTASAPAQGTTAAVAGDYASSIEAKTNAGDYSFELTAAANTNYTDKVAVKWSIAKAKVNVDVNAKANLTYDGAVLDASDFEFTAAQNDTLAQQVIAEMTKAEGETAPKTNITVTPITENLPYTPKTDINNDNVGYYLYDTPFNQYYYHSINIGRLDPGAYIKLPGMNDPIPASQASYIDFNTNPYHFVIEKGGTLEYWFNRHIYSTPLTEGNGWYLQKTENYQYGLDKVTLYEVVQKALPTKTYDLKNAGIQKAKITITNPNIDVVVNNGSSVTAEIAKKKVTITPKADQKAIFGDIKTVDDANSTVDDKFFVPEYTFDGVVDADKAIITTFGDILDVKYNKIAVDETKADVTTYGTTTEYAAVENLGDALAQSNKKINTNYSYSIDELYDYVTDNTNITLPNGENGYTFKYEDRDSSVKYDNTSRIFIDSEGTLKYTKGTLNVDEVIEVIWDNDVTTVPLTAGNVWVVTGELWSNEDDGYQNGYDGKYKSVEIKQVPVSESADFVNAGTYEFVLEKNDDGANYQFELAQNAPTYAIEQKSLKSEDISLTVDTPTYTYDGNKKNAPTNYVIVDAQVGTLAKDKDFEVGGQTAAVLPNTYDLEFSGLNNYKDMIKSQWKIKSDTTYDITVSVEDKTYDGTTIVPTFAYTQKNPNFDSAQLPSEENPERINITKADLPKNTKTTLTYYKLANDTAVPQTTEDLAALNLTALEGAPKDAGKYVVVAKTTARGYEILDSIDTFVINQKEITVTPAITSIEYGKFNTLDPTKYTYDTTAIVAGDTVNVTGQITGLSIAENDVTKYGYKVGVYDYVIPTPEAYANIPAEYKDLIIHVDNPNYKLATNAKLTVTQCEIKDDDIKVTGKCVAGADGWAYPNSCVKVVVSLYNVETKQYEEVELTEGTDFDITSATKTKQLGEFNVEVEGNGNYTTDPVAVAAVDVVTEAYLNDFVKISEPFASVNSSGVGRVSATFTHEIPEGYTVTESGILYVKDANCATDLTLDNEGKSGIGKKVNTVTGSTSQTLNVTDPNGVGAKMRGYMKVAKGDNTYTVYTDEISATYAELAIKNATNIDISAPKATVNASGKGRVSATFTHEVANGFTVTESGILYVKDANCATDLTLDNVGKSGIGNKVNTVAGSTSQTLNVTDPDGKGAKMRGYVIVTDGNISKTFYTDEVSGTYIDLAFSDAVSVNISAPKATVNASGTGRVSATFTYEAADGYTVTESGMLYVKDADCATELTLDNLGVAGIGKKVNTVESSTSQTLNVTDPNGNGAKMRGYVTVTDGATTKTIYTDEISGKYAELSAQ